MQLTESKADGHKLYIVGVGRSGTSLAQSMFASHSQLAFPPETAFVRRLIVGGLLDDAIRNKDYGLLRKQLAEDPLLQRLDISVDELVAAYREPDAQSASALYRLLLDLTALDQGRPYSGDKDPRSVEFLPLVRGILPGVHVVHMIRDPRDVLASKKKAAWSSGHSVLRHVFAARVQLKLGRRAGRDLGNNYHEIVYEQLLAEPAAVLADMCQSVGLAFETSMLSFGDSAARLVSDEEMSWKKETLGPLLSGNRGKWKKSLSDWEVALTELLCAEHFSVGGYQYANCRKQLPFLHKAGLYLVAGGLMLVDPLFCWYRRRSVRRAIRKL